MDSDKRSAAREAERVAQEEQIKQEKERREAQQKANETLMLLLMAGLP